VERKLAGDVGRDHDPGLAGLVLERLTRRLQLVPIGRRVRDAGVRERLLVIDHRQAGPVLGQAIGLAIHLERLDQTGIEIGGIDAVLLHEAVELEQGAVHHEVRRGHAVDVEDVGNAAGSDIGLKLGRIVGRYGLVGELDIRVCGAELIENLLEEFLFGVGRCPAGQPNFNLLREGAVPQNRRGGNRGGRQWNRADPVAGRPSSVHELLCH